MLKKTVHFFKEYREFGITVIAIIAGGILALNGLTLWSNIILGVTAGLNAIPLVWGMLQDVRDGKYGIDILAATAIIASLLLGEYWAAIIIVLMLTGGEALEDYAEKRAKSELTDLLARAPRKANLLKGGKVTQILASKVQVRDKLIVKPGELIPVDAVILEGATSVDEASLTGESLPVDKVVGDTLLSGTVNLDGVITVKALRVAADSQYEQIIKLVKSASSHQAPFVRLADRYSIPFTIIAYIIAASVWIMSGDPMRFLQVIVVATPCPLLLAAPIALISGMSRAAKHGIIIKTGSALEKLAEVRTVAFDKTGTLTYGKPTISKIVTYGKFKRTDILQAAGSLERNSNHSLAHVIVNAAVDGKVKLTKVKQAREEAGYGLRGMVNRQEVLVGNALLLEREGVAIPAAAQKVATTSVLVAVDGTLAGAIQFTDEPRPESKATLQRLKQLGVRSIMMITGDNSAAANAIGKKLGVTDIHANALPGEKLQIVEDAPNKPVAFVGDGVNDAPVLTAADVGIALGAKGSAAASESADVVIMLDDLGRVATAVDVAKRSFFIAKQSILIGIIISVGLMLIYATGRFSPVSGALLQEVVDVVVILNALRAHGSWRKNQQLKRLANRPASV